MPSNDGIKSEGPTILICISTKEVDQLPIKQDASKIVQESDLSTSTLEEGSFQKCILYSSSSSFKVETIAKSFRLVKEGGSISVQSTKPNQQLVLDLLSVGFMDFKEISNSEITATRPKSVAATSFKLKGKGTTTNTTTSAPQKSSVWSFSGTENSELEDENSLLSEEDIKAKKQKRDDCETSEGQRKACKNCVCGRKEGTSSIPTPQFAEKEVAKSSCGNCHLGDAFRCGGCPYLGKPAFKPGEVVTLDLQDDI